MAMDNSFVGDREAQVPTQKRKHGGWITFPFMIATMASLTLTAGGWMSNIIVYLIGVFNVKSIDAAQISNVINGSVSLFPVLGAVIADSFLGCYSVIWISSFISLLGVILLLLTTTIDSLKPQPCDISSSLCTPASKLQFAVLYAALALSCIGVGGTRFTMVTMGADQFSKPKDQDSYFNWYFFTIYTASVIASTGIVFLQDNVSWACGFGLSIATNVLGLAIFLFGSPFYIRVKPKGSPFTGLARVVIATIRKRKVLPTSSNEDYYLGRDGETKTAAAAPSNNFRFLNRAAVKVEGDIKSNGSIAKPWNLSTVQEVEDLKSLIRIFPLWSSSIFLSTPIGMQYSLSILQALKMDRHLGSHFKIPAGSIIVIVLISTSICLSLFDNFLWPSWKKLTGRTPTPLQRVGVGHVFNIASMALSAIVETKRRESNHFQGQGSTVAMSVLWLVPQLVTVGIGEAFHFPGQVALYYQEFPPSLKSISSAMVSMVIAIAFYLSTALVDFVRRITEWLPDDINKGKLENIYWAMVVIGVLNFGYYLLCSWFYKYQNLEAVAPNHNT